MKKNLGALLVIIILVGVALPTMSAAESKC